MRFSSLLSLVAGLGIAGGSAYLARDLLETKYAQGEVKQCTNELVRVVVAMQDIPFGRVIDGAKLDTIDWPATAVPPGGFTRVQDLLPTGSAEPRRAKMAIAKGEILLASKVSSFGEKVTIVQSLGPDSRAISIKVTADTGVGGFVTPGDKVDVILTHGKAENLKTVTIIQNVRVIGVDQEADAEKEKPGVAKTVTLEVTAEDSQKLALAQKAGTLSLVLRTIENEDEKVLEAISLRDVLQEPEPVEAVAPEEVTVRSVVVRRGIDETEDELN